MGISHQELFIVKAPRAARVMRTARGFANASVRVMRNMHPCSNPMIDWALGGNGRALCTSVCLGLGNVRNAVGVVS